MDELDKLLLKVKYLNDSLAVLEQLASDFFWLDERLDAGTLIPTSELKNMLDTLEDRRKQLIKQIGPDGVAHYRLKQSDSANWTAVDDEIQDYRTTLVSASGGLFEIYRVLESSRAAEEVQSMSYRFGTHLLVQRTSCMMESCYDKHRAIVAKLESEM